MKKPFDALVWVERTGVALVSARGPVPNLAETVAGEPIRGSWWGHPKGQDIFNSLTVVSESPDVVFLKLIGGKLTMVHRRLWPALARLAGEWPAASLTAVSQEHTPSGAHRNRLIPLAKWLPAESRRAAEALSVEEARAALGSWSQTISQAKRRSTRKRR